MSPVWQVASGRLASFLSFDSAVGNQGACACSGARSAYQVCDLTLLRCISGLKRLYVMAITSRARRPCQFLTTQWHCMNGRAEQVRRGRIQMHKIRLFAVAAALILAGAAGWVATTTHARVEAPVSVEGISPSQITMNARICRLRSLSTTLSCSIERSAGRPPRAPRLRSQPRLC